MQRINVMSYPTEREFVSDPDARITLAGWFDADRATLYKPDTYWDGNNNCDVNTRDAHRHQYLYRTAQGRWVLEHTSSWQGEQTRHEFLDDQLAREWLILNGEDTAVAQWFGEVEEERGPGRPAIGTRRNVTLSDEDWSWLADEATRLNLRDRAAVVRKLIADTRDQA